QPCVDAARGQQRRFIGIDRDEQGGAAPEQPQRLHRALGAPENLAIGTQLVEESHDGPFSATRTRTMDDAPRGRALDGWTIVLGIAALGNLVNGAWMLAAPAHWYATLPAAVPDFGPLNEHFVRDIGCAFFVQGVALAVAAVNPRWRFA